MPQSKKSRNAAGNGTIRKKTVQRNGKEYTYWEARFTTGYDPATGKQKQRSITGKTQKEVAQKLREATAELDQGTYTEPCKMTLGQWPDIWQAEYLQNVKPLTREAYEHPIRNYFIPALGNIRLCALTTPDIQRFYNSLTKRGLSAKTVKNFHGILHRALQQAVAIGYLRINPTNACTLPRVVHKELKPLDDYAISDFLRAVKGHRFERIYLVDLFTGMRKGEILGLTWDCVDLIRGTLYINKQLQQSKDETGKRGYHLVATKNSRGRTISLPPSVVALLKRQRAAQNEWRLRAGTAWQDSGLVFTDELGGHLVPDTVYTHYKRIVASIGRPDARLHDLRHSYAVAAIRAGDDIKTVQGNLGHATAAFTLDIYGHVTDQMRQAGADRMERYIQSVSGL